MKKIILTLAILTLGAGVLSPVSAKSLAMPAFLSTASGKVNLPPVASIKLANQVIHPACGALFVALKESINKPENYKAIVDFNKDKEVSLADFAIFSQNRFKKGWCEKQIAK